MEPKSVSVIFTIGDNTNNNIKGPGPTNYNDHIINHDDINKTGDAPHAHDDQHHQSEDDHNYEGAITTAALVPATTDNSHKPKKKRSGGAMHILQVATFLLRRRRRPVDKSKPTSLALEGQALASSKSTWKRLVGSIRPLHLQSSSSNPTTPLHTLAAPSENYEDVLPPPMSPARTDDLSSEDGMTSRYASAVNLQELDRTTEQEQEDDNAIDAKAEEFIAQFYHQMRLQRLDSIDNRRRMIQGSIG